MAQTLATLAATFARSRTTMPATFATFPETFPATLAERHARRSSRRSPRPTPQEQGAAADKATGAKGRRQAGSASGKPRRTGQRHAIRQQTRRTAHAERRQYRGQRPELKRLIGAVKWQIRHTKKPPEYTGSKGKPRTACAMRGGGHFWSLARSKSRRIGCNRIYNKIKGGTSAI